MKGKSIAIPSIIIISIISCILIGGELQKDKQAKQDMKEQRELNISIQGAEQGYVKAISDISDIALQCKQIPINTTQGVINLIAYECLQNSEDS